MILERQRATCEGWLGSLEAILQKYGFLPAAP